MKDDLFDVKVRNSEDFQDLVRVFCSSAVDFPDFPGS